jgi:hypothetical protein
VADYSAKIQLLVEGLDKLDRLQKRVSDLNKEVDRLSKPLFKEGTKAIADIINDAANAQENYNKSVERSTIKQIKLNSAVALYERRLKELKRVGATEQQQFAPDIAQIKSAFDTFKRLGSVSGVQAVATELGRVIEYSREQNRLEFGRLKSTQQLRDFNVQIQKLKAAGLNTSKAEATFDKLAVNAGTNRYALAEKYQFLLGRRIRLLNEELREQQRLANVESKRLREQEIATAKQQRERTQRISNVALGAGFPLLFGGGPGAVLGGAAGGLVGGPAAFAAQIALSAIGQQLDMFVAEVAKTGVALTSTGGTFEYMREKALFSSTAVEDQAIALEEQGRVSELAALLTQDLAKSIGGEGVQALQELGDETNELTKQWNTLTAQLFALVAGPLKDFIAILNTVLGGITTERRLSVLRSEATPAQQKRLAKITREVVGGTVKNVRGGGTQFVAGPEGTPQRLEILRRAASEGIVPTAPAGRITSEDRRSITAPRTKAPGKTSAEREAERLAKELARSLKIGADLERQFSRQVSLLNAASDIERERLKIGFNFEDRLLKIKELKNAEQRAVLQTLNYDLLRLETQKLQNKELKNELDLFAKKAGIQFGEMLPGGAGAFRTDITLGPSTGLAAEIEKVKQELETLLDPITQVSTAAEGIGAAFSDSFKGVISGTMTAQEALANFFQNVADQFLDMAAQMIAKWIQLAILNSVLKLFPTDPAIGAAAGGGFTLPGGEGFTAAFLQGAGVTPRAKGGPVTGGMPYMVGERGPELFVPGRSGSIVPNNQLGGGDNVSVVVNVDAKGTNVQGNDQQGNQLGRAISAAVQAELVKQKRPGGLLAV